MKWLSVMAIFGRGFCNGKIAQVLAKHQAGVCWIVHTHDSLLVIVLVVHQDGVVAFEVEGKPPVSADRHSPVALN